MTRKEKIDTLVTHFMLTATELERELKTEEILREGFRGFNNYSVEELDEIINLIHPNRLSYIADCRELISLIRENAEVQKLSGSKEVKK